MNMKKKIVPLFAAALTMMSALPVMASGELSEQNISNLQQTGNTTVVANVDGTAQGDVTYVVSVPSYIDFGSLSRDEGNTASSKDVSITGTVKLTEVDGLAEDQRVAVLMQDTVNGINGFQISAISGAALSNGKKLNYKVTIGNQEINSTNSTTYPNGFLVGSLKEVDNTINVSFALDQNQMTGVLDDWAGTYQGTITFYSRVAGISDYN